MASAKLLERQDGVYRVTEAGVGLLETERQLKFVAVLGHPKIDTSTLLNSILDCRVFQTDLGSHRRNSTDFIETLNRNNSVYIDIQGIPPTDLELFRDLYSIVFTLADIVILVIDNPEASEQPGFLQDSLQQAFNSVVSVRPVWRHLILAFTCQSVTESQKSSAIAGVVGNWFQALGSQAKPIYQYFHLEALQLVFDPSSATYTLSSLQPIQTSISSVVPVMTGYQALSILDSIVVNLNNLKAKKNSLTSSPSNDERMEEYMRFVTVFLRQKRDAVDTSIAEAYAASQANKIQAGLSQFLGAILLRPLLIESLIFAFREEIDALRVHALDLIVKYTIADIKYHHFKMDACELAESCFRLHNYENHLGILKHKICAELGSGIVSDAIRVKMTRFERKLSDRLEFTRKHCKLKMLLYGMSAAVSLAIGHWSFIGLAAALSMLHCGCSHQSSLIIRLGTLQAPANAVKRKLNRLKARIEAQAPELMFELDQRGAPHDFGEYDLEYILFRQLRGT